MIEQGRRGNRACERARYGGPADLRSTVFYESRGMMDIADEETLTMDDAGITRSTATVRKRSALVDTRAVRTTENMGDGTTNTIKSKRTMSLCRTE